MQNWLNFFSFIFWLNLVLFVSNLDNLIKLILYSELIWISLYCYTIFYGSINNDLNLITFSIFILGFAGIEYGLGILILILLKHSKKNFNVLDNFSKKDFNNISKTQFFFNRYVWFK